MTGAMYSAVAGLKAHMSALNVIGNNISNVNTNAYKATRYTFLESLYSSVRNGSNGSNTVGGKNPAQNGYGASIGTIDLDMSTKNYTPTGINGDCMINGNGFFIVGDKNKVIQNSNELKDMYLTRHGDLKFDNAGYLVDGMGQVVYGFLCTQGRQQVMVERPKADGTVELVPKEPEEWEDTYTGQPILTALRLPMMTSKACAVTTLDKDDGNLKAGMQKIISMEDYEKLDPKEKVKYSLKEKGDAIYPSFDTNGNLIDARDGDFLEQDRVVCDSISIDEKTGRVSCVTTNQEIVVVGYIAIAKVDNPNGVTHVDGRYYQALDGAGNVYASTIGGSVMNGTPPADPTKVPFYIDKDTGRMAGEYDGILNAGNTTLIAGGLESSGTDLATEISNMIMIERGYQANTRIVTVTDAMLEELVNMKR